MRNKILSLLVLLLTAVTGAWAAEEVLLTTIESKDYNTFFSGSKTFDDMVTITFSNNVYNYGNNFGWFTGSVPSLLTVAGTNGYTITSCKFYTNDGIANTGYTVEGESPSVYLSDLNVYTDDSKSVSIGTKGVTKIEVYTASDGIEVTPVAEPAANTKQWTFSMPGSDVVLTPQYAPAAQLDENGAPAAVSGLEIAADAAIITAGQSAQGTLLYAVTASETEKPALTAFSATLPNAKDQTAAGNYYVWYYIQGHDTPQGQEPSADNTFNDSEIMGPVKVELLTNEHTLNIKQSPNITVTVAGTAKTPTDDKVTPVTTGQEVKIKANTGYKFRKVEVKKGAKAPTTAQLNVPTGWNGDNTNVTANDLPGFVALTDEEAANIPCPDAEGYVYVIHNFVGDGYIRIIAFYNGERQGQQSHTLARYHDEIYYDVNDNQIKYYYTTGK